MQVLEKILEEIELFKKKSFDPVQPMQSDKLGIWVCDRITDIIRSHMEDESVSNPDKLSNGWIPAEERLPEDAEDLEVTLADGMRHIAWLGDKGNWYDSLAGFRGEKVDVIAWKEASTPYQPRKETGT